MNILFHLLADAGSPGYEGVFADLHTTVWSAILRMTQAIVAAASFLVAGVFAAGALRGMVGAQRMRSLLGVGHWSGPLRAWALGVLLPVCSLGAIPMARELRRAGVPSGTVLSFVLVAPVLNPVSVIYGLSHIEPVMLLYFAAGTFLVSVGTGAIWNRLIASRQDKDPQQLERAPVESVDRLKVAAHTAATTLTGPAIIDYGLAVLAVGFLGAFLPHGALQTGLTRDNPLAPVIMGVIAIPVYVTPTEVMMHFGHIVNDGYSLGAAFSLIVLGAGANVGVANWVRRDYGLKALGLFVLLLIGSTLVIGLTADRTIISGAADQTDHTHAFDPFTRLSSVNSTGSTIEWLALTVYEELTPDRLAGIVLLILMAGAGLMLRMVPSWRSVGHLVKSDKKETVSTRKWDPALSPFQLYIATASAVLIAAVVGLYIYYPPTGDLFGDMANIRVNLYDALREEDSREALRRLRQLRGRAEKLPASVKIRFGDLTPQQQKSVDEVLYSINTLEDFLEAGKLRESMILKSHLEDSYMSCVREFRDQNTAYGK